MIEIRIWLTQSDDDSEGLLRLQVGVRELLGGLRAEFDGLRSPIHAFDNSQRLHSVALVAKHSAAFLLPLLYGDADTRNFAAGLLHQVD